jgi:hypothetical protein
MEQFVGKFYNLSMQKYSSNVVEKCLEKCDESIITKFIEEISQHTRVIDLIKNSYGNYVVQKALKLSTGNNKTSFINCIKKNLEKLTDKKLTNKWKTILNNSMHLNLGAIEYNTTLNSSNSSNNSSQMSNNSAYNASPIMSPSFPGVKFNTLSPNQKFSKSLTGSPVRMLSLQQKNFMLSGVYNMPMNNNNK